MGEYKYEQIADTIRSNIDAGNYPEGRLPSTSMLCKEFSASYGSVRTAIMILKTEGRVVGRQGEGVFVRRS
jgi:DNA-binding GntR family transcriptional regulator